MHILQASIRIAIDQFQAKSILRTMNHLEYAFLEPTLILTNSIGMPKPVRHPGNSTMTKPRSPRS